MSPHVTTDPTGFAPAPRPLDAFFLARLRDPRDLIFVRTALAIGAFVVPCTLLAYTLPTWLVAALALPYLGVLFTQFAGRYVLMLHAVVHRPPFKKEYAWMDMPIRFLLAPYIGQTPNSFHVHHIGMHHVEGNLEDDISSTTGYQRDNLLHWLHYWARFFFFGYVHLSRYLWLRGRTRMLTRFWAGELSWYAGIGLLFWLNPVATSVLFVAPFVLMRLLMMSGNWAQHAFVDPDDPGNSYKNSTILSNTPYNHKCYNDGYHIVHHLKPGLHWSDMPGEFHKNWQKYAENDALVFSGIRDNQRVFLALMQKDYRFLAERLVQLGEQKRTVEELEAMLRRRVQPIDARKGLVEFRESAGDSAQAVSAA